MNFCGKGRLKEKLKTKWAQLETIVRAKRRLEVIARDLVEHFESRLLLLHELADMR